MVFGFPVRGDWITMGSIGCFFMWMILLLFLWGLLLLQISYYHKAELGVETSGNLEEEDA